MAESDLFVAKLEKLAEEEHEDHIKYHEIADKFRDIDHEEYGQIFDDIANEEETHQEYIEYVISKLKGAHHI